MYHVPPHLNPGPGATADWSTWIDQFCNVPALVIGDGPSRNLIEPHDPRLDHILTIGCNRAGEAYQPTIVVCGKVRWQTDHKCYDQQTTLAAPIWAWCPHHGPRLLVVCDRSILPRPPRKGTIFPAGKAGGVALHLAYNLGCNPIYCIGLDGYNFVGPKHAYEEHEKPQSAIPNIDVRQSQLQQLMITQLQSEGREAYDLCPPPRGLKVFPPKTWTQLPWPPKSRS